MYGYNLPIYVYKLLSFHMHAVMFHVSTKDDKLAVSSFG